MPENGPTIFAAGLLLPISASPIREGAVLVRDGLIEAVGTLDEIGRGNPSAELRYFPHYTVVPGAVNAHAHLGFRRDGLPERVRAEVSVHSPYTVDPESSRLAARRTRELGWRLAIHLSESPEEMEFLKRGTGGLADIFGTNGWGGVGVSPVRYAQSIELLAPETIAAHLATGVSEEDIAVLAQTGVAVALCPRSNAYLRCGVSSVSAMIAGGIRVGMGTDGLWSSPSMNLFEETLFAVELHDMSSAAGLELATLGGARALGIEAETGTLETGKWADLAVVETSQEDGDPALDVLEAAA